MRALLLVGLVGCASDPTVGDIAGPRYDFDGDGLEDVVVGASTVDENQGAVWVFLGATGLDGRSHEGADATWTGRHPFQNFGRSVTGCDLDGDGTGDLVVGGGGISVWWGGETFGTHAAADLPVTGSEALGGRVLCGDLSGDGVADLVATEEIDGEPAIVVWFGGETRRTEDVGLTTAGADLVIPGDRETGLLVDPALDLGEVTGDGVLDLVAGSPTLRVDGAWGMGAVHVWFGGELDATADLAVLGGEEGGFFGRSLAAVDLDGDGADDLAVGTLAGHLDLFRGGEDLDALPERVLARPEVAVDDPAWSASVQRPWRHDLEGAGGMIEVRARLSSSSGEARQGAVFMSGLLDDAPPRCMGVVTEEPLRLADAVGAVRTGGEIRILLGAPGAPSMDEGRVYAIDPAALGLDAAEPCGVAVQTRVAADLGAAELRGPRSFGASMGN